jgi:hypothetical protein
MRGKRFSFKGYYKSWFFRSLKELSYVLLCEDNGLKWQTAEVEELAVWYEDIYGHRRKHYADFLVDGHIIVEVKPAKHQKGKLVQLKAKAMKAFCQQKGFEYMMVSPRKVNPERLSQLITNGLVIFTEDCKDKILSYLENRL